MRNKSLMTYICIARALFLTEVATGNQLDIDTGRVQFGASLSRASLGILLLFTKCYHNNAHNSILEKEGTNCMAASVNIPL